MLAGLKQLVPENVPKEQVETLMGQGKQILPQILGLVGIKIPVEEAPLSSDHAANTKTTTFIEDVRLWRATLEVSKGASPVIPLNEFEEHVSKL